MKKISNHILSLSALTLFFVGCTNLDVDIKSQYTTLPSTQDAVDAISGSVYNSYREALGENHWLVQSISSDECVAVALGSDYYDGGRFRDLDLHSWTADHPHLPALWNGAMNGINTANNVLAQISGDQHTAPIRVMRAFYYFLLMDNFGAVPILKEKGQKQPDRSPRPEVAAFVEKELLECLDHLSTEVDEKNYGKVTRYMAEALLVKLYLNWNVYNAADVANYSASTPNSKLNDAVKYCDDIINSGKFNLNDDYWSKFLPTNGPQIKDFIYAMPYDRVTQRGMHYARWWAHRDARAQFDHETAKSVSGVLRGNAAYCDKFNLPGDVRNELWLKGPQYHWNNYQITDRPFTVSTTKKGVDQFYAGADGDAKVQWQVTFTKDVILRPELGNPELTMNAGNDKIGRSMGYRNIKFYMDPNTTSEDDRSQSNDVPVFRYADVLLMKAEAILRGATATNGDTPMSLLNQVRQCAKAPLMTTNPTLDELLDERAREFVCESWRRNDLIRFGKFEELWGLRSYHPQSANEKFRRIFPVPTSVLNANTNWKQNNGY